MSDYPNTNVHRGDGVSARGLLVAVAIIVAIIALLSLVGGAGEGVEGAATQDAITPALEAPAAPTAVPTE